MSCILYYSKFCEHSKKIIQALSKTNVQNDIHFISIDNRTKDANGKTFIILENGQKIILPENVNRVPALLLLNKGYEVLYGESILQHLKPRQEVLVKQATQNNMEPLAFSFGSGGFGDIVSDTYSFLDQSPEDLQSVGNGGMRQMHNYMNLNSSQNVSFSSLQNDNNNSNTTIRGTNKMPEDASNQQMESRLKKMQEDRDADLKRITGNRPPMSY